MLANILAVVGVFFTVLFGCLAFRRKKYPIRMRFYVLDLVQLTDPQDRKYKNLSISYANTEISEGLLYFKGLFVNEGDADTELKCDDIKQNVHICLPAGCRWLELHQAESNEDVNAKFSINADGSNDVIVKTNLFKRNEIFAVEGLIAGRRSDLETGVNSIKVKHRLKNTDKISVERLSISDEKEDRSASNILGIAGIIIIAMVTLFAHVVNQEKPINFTKHGDETLIVYSAKGYTADSVIVTTKDKILPTGQQSYSLVDFNKEFEVCTKETRGDYVAKMILLSIGTFVSVFILIMWLYVHIKGGRKRYIITSLEKINT